MKNETQGLIPSAMFQSRYREAFLFKQMQYFTAARILRVSISLSRGFSFQAAPPEALLDVLQSLAFPRAMHFVSTTLHKYVNKTLKAQYIRLLTFCEGPSFFAPLPLPEIFTLNFTQNTTVCQVLFSGLPDQSVSRMPHRDGKR